MTMIIRLVTNVALIVVAVGLVAVSVVLLIKFANFIVQWVAGQFGYEVGDFFQWAKSRLPRRK